MTSPSPTLSQYRPLWAHCRSGASQQDPVGCRGILVFGHTACLAHLNDANQSAYLAGLSPGSDIDHRGTTFEQPLIDAVLDAVRDPVTRRPRFGTAQFDEATFPHAGFDGVTFENAATFDRATFESAAFIDANFSGQARFHRAAFSADAIFAEATFSGDAVFVGATFSRALFSAATFSADATFQGVTFSGDVWFQDAVVAGKTDFTGATFTGDATFDGATFTGEAVFSEGSTHDSSGAQRATFSSHAKFRKVTFTGDVSFGETTFSRDADFGEAVFSGIAGFRDATFTGDAGFRSATFAGAARFGRATFSSDAGFEWAAFSSRAGFESTTFSGNAGFDRVVFSRNVVLQGARFEVASRLGPLVCGGQVMLDGAVFEQPVTLEIAALRVGFERTRWASTATVHLRYAELDLTGSIFEYPIMIAAQAGSFRSVDVQVAPVRGEPLPEVPEAELSGRDPAVHLVSINGVDAAYLALQDVDLSLCRFAGAVHLDQLRVDGWCTFASVPTGWGRRFPWRWSRRNTLAEEHYWRVRTAGGGEHATARGWAPPPQSVPELRPAAVAALYRQLRKSLEDGKNEPDAADFYYGECEMRRHDVARPWAERALLRAYWALSGYGLRAGRALGWLGAAVVATVAVLMLWGLPVDDPKPVTTGRQTGQDITLTTDTPSPVNPTGPLHERVTTERFEKSLRVVINSVVFRSSGQDLTTAGTYTEMTSRITEPVLLGLAILAIRNRVKR